MNVTELMEEACKNKQARDECKTGDKREQNLAIGITMLAYFSGNFPPSLSFVGPKAPNWASFPWGERGAFLAKRIVFGSTQAHKYLCKIMGQEEVNLVKNPYHNSRTYPST